MSDYLSEIRGYLEEDISMIQKASKILQWLCDVYFNFRKCPDKYTDSRRDAIINLVIAIFLEQWLEYDPDAKQTIKYFSHQEYIRKKHAQINITATADNDIPTLNDLADYEYDSISAYKKKLRRKWSILEGMLNLQIDDAINRGVSPKPLQDMKIKKFGRKLDPVTLNFLSYYADGQLALFDLLARRKEFLTITSDKGSNTSLIEAYHRYDNIYEDAKSLDDEQYVITCIQLHKLERTYRFHLSAAIAKYMKDHDIPFDSLSAEKANQFWAAYTIRVGERSHICYQYDVLHYDWEIHQLFEDQPSLIQDGTYQSLRVVVDDLLIFLDIFMFGSTSFLKDRAKGLEPSPASIAVIPHWTEHDFSEAAAFFRKEYPIIEAYTPTDFGEEPGEQKAYGKYIKEVLRELADPERLDRLRNEIGKNPKGKNEDGGL